MLLSNKKERIIDTLTLWMHLQRNILSEKSEFQKVTYCMISFTEHSPNGRTD